MSSGSLPRSNPPTPLNPASLQNLSETNDDWAEQKNDPDDFVDIGAPHSPLQKILVAYRLPLLISLHLIIFAISFWLAFALRFDFNIPKDWLNRFLVALPVMVVVEFFMFAAFRSFNGWWSYFTFRDVLGIARPLMASFVVFGVLDLFFGPHIQVPRSIHVLNILVAGALLCSLRSVWRVSKEGIVLKRIPDGCRPALIICDHHESFVIAHQINNRTGSNVHLTGILSNVPSIIGANRGGMRVLGNPMDGPKLAKKLNVKEVWVVAGDISGKQVVQLKALYDSEGLQLKVIPSSLDLESGNGKIPLREIDINDLLHRDPVKLDTDMIADQIEGRRVLVTGAGGSIGSELCRQIIRFNPAEIVLLDHRENSVFLIHNELKRKNTPTKLVPAVGDILDLDRMQRIFETHSPEFVYHAAAHKHVGLMEINTGEAIKNNVLGTRRVAELAHQHEVHKFVLVSTDKAVNPTSVMGCTKNIAERFVLSMADRSDTRFVIVRFGNVLGSNGSVVPLFKEQIAAGGPVTVTDERMTRYFMTIPEASQLVLQAGAMGEGGEIFVLEMGEQVRIMDLAKQLIRLSGLPSDSIEIKTIGIRPGEKLYEELHIDPAQLLDTEHPKINAAYQHREAWEETCQFTDELVAMAHGPSETIRARLKNLIPEYKSDLHQPAGVTAPETSGKQLVNS